ncbi:HTH-type transcriptional repressor NemR [Tsuneonella dongtanensis]|uniref:HTH-type transcriptional repressor NemR n=1 Tax=Tsuneonella dongtanensis TaxID=692370 RepID=A0A1B2ACU6_9SPHN|nr:TetR/AcrR family transcriptional regulator [Tsuneonella dongtanensis]ANY19973.1 HTH-type transcriptional repressor NemR [Tsuneonella dongtanensis]
MKTSRDELLRIGEEIVCRQGLAGLSFGEVAQRAGIRKASVHHHFASKAIFAAALVSRLAELAEADLSDAEADHRRGYLALKTLLRERRDQIDDGHALDPLTALAAGADALDDATRAALGHARELVLRRIASILQAGRRDRTISVAGDIEEEARAVLAQIEGAELAARAAGDGAMFDRTIATLEKRMAAH